MWYLVLSHTVATSEAEARRKANLQAHMDWLVEAHRAGRILFSGPTPDKSVGIYVMMGPDVEEVTAYAAQDPHHVTGERTLQVLEWDAQRAMRLDTSIAAIEGMAKEG